MSLTPAEQAELDRLEREQQDHITREFGDPIANAHVEAVSKPIRAENETHSSLFRSIIGIPRDAAAGYLDLMESAGNWLEQRLPLPVVRFGANASNGILDVVSGQKAADFTATHRLLPELPDLPGSEHAGTAEKLIRGIGSFLLPFAGWGKVVGLGEASLSLGQKLLRGGTAGFLADLSQDPSQTNMATALKETFGIDNPTLDALAYHADGDDLEERLRAAATNIPVGIIGDSLFELGAKGIRAYRDWKGTAEEAKGIINTLEHDFTIRRSRVEPGSVDAEAGLDEIVKGIEASASPFDAAIHARLEDIGPPKTWTDVLDFLNKIVDDPHLSDEMVNELGKIVHEDPENALTRLGIDPAKLDYEAFDNPEGVKNLHQSLINIYEKAAGKLGRTGERVSEATILYGAARAFASDADVLRALFGRTQNLPEILMGARMFVGGHSKRLLDDAEAALNALKEGGGEDEWQKFLSTFYRHALYMGSIRGAGSEIARALKSLQFIARHDPKQAIKEAERLASAVPAGANKDAEAVAQEQLQGLLTMDDPAERQMVLSKLLAKGDPADIAMFVRRQNGSILKQVDGAVREEVGNLFSQSTAAYNFAASMTMMSLRSLGRWMAAGARIAAGAFSADQARLARVATADAWAYTDGMMSAWSESWRNMLTALKADGATELFLNADNLGLKSLAKKAAEWSAEGAKLSSTGKNFERVDMRAAQHVIALSPADRRGLDQWIESYDMPRLMEGAMKFMARTAGVVINAAGTATRMGTILFVNAPDQLAGSLAARAGQQAAAVREAAIRAAELGLEGPELTKYLKARVAALAEPVGEGWADQGYEAGFRDTVQAAGEHEARAVLFQDRLESGVNRALTKAHHEPSIIFPLAIPFLHTPLRILERSLIDYTPLGLFKSRIQEAILRGTPEQREQALAQMSLGIMGMYLGYKLADDRTIVGKDGSFYSTARMARENYTIHAFGDTFQFNRLDPLATILGLAADYHTYMNTYYDPNDPEAKDKGQAMFEAGAWAIAANVLSKTYLESLKDITDLATSVTEGQFQAKFDNFWKNMLARRNVPGAGIQKGIRQVYDPWEHEAITFYDRIIKETIGATSLPFKRDWLGAPEPVNFGERFTGLTWQPYTGDQDPLLKQMDQISLDVRLPRKDIKGVKLTATQYSRLLELRGKVVQGPYGTMEEALKQLTEHPDWDRLTKDAKEFQVKTLVDGYTQRAHQALLAEDKHLARKVYLEDAYQTLKDQGMRPEELQKKTEEFRRQLDDMGYL